jgi:hypothetical protein
MNPTPKAHRRARHSLQWIVAVAIFLIALRIALPYAVRDYVNRADGYSGRIGDVNMRLWRGGYRIQQIEILRKTGDVTTPLFSAPQVDLSIDWRELFHGSVVGEVVVR